MKMNRNKKLSRTLTATAVAAMLAVTSGAGYAAEIKSSDSNLKPPMPITTQENQNQKQQDKQLTDRETVGTYLGWQDPDMARIAVHGGRALLRHVEAAHAALQAGKDGEVRSSLEAAQDFAQGLQMMIPYTVVVDNIRNAKHELLASNTGLIVDDLLPVYSSLDEMAAYAPELAHSAKTKLDEAVNHMKQGDKQKAAEKLDEIAADISSTTVYLPVLYVQSQVGAALHALNEKTPDTKTAKAAVDNAMDSMVHATINMHILPESKTAGKTPAAPVAKDTNAAAAPATTAASKPAITSTN